MGSNAGPKIPNAKCPLCGEEDWTTTPAFVLPQAGVTEPGFGLSAQPLVCAVCGYIALMSFKEH